MAEARAESRRITQAHWRHYTDIPLTIAAALFLVFYSWEVIADLKPPEDLVAETAMWIIWAFFVVDFIVNLVLADRKVHWFFTHFLDFLIVALPALRPLRLLRLVTLLKFLNRGAGRALRGRVVTYAGGAAVILVFVAALAELDVERNAPGSHIHTFGDSLWWACVTIASVGYGDITPVTVEGRFIAVGVMIAGIALIGTVAATFASFFIDRVAVTTKVESDETQAALADLTAEIASLRAELRLVGRRDAPPLAELDVERNAPGSHIHTFGDSLWWACVTIASVGYGDITPVTVEGRFIAVGVMIAGIALIGTVAATFASFFIDRVAVTTKVESDETQAALADLTAEIASLRAELRLVGRRDAPPLAE